MRSGIRFGVMTGVGLLAVVLAVVFASRVGSDPRLAPSPLIGRSAPDVAVDIVESDSALALLS